MRERAHATSLYRMSTLCQGLVSSLAGDGLLFSFCKYLGSGHCGALAKLYKTCLRAGSSSRAPNRCINLVKSTNYNISRGRIIDIVQMRQYIAETSAKVMGHGAPSQPKLQLQCTVSFC